MVQDYIEWSHSVDAKQQNEEEIVPRTRKFVRREREEAHERLFHDYFSNEPLYHENIFHQRFRMHKHVFLRIVEGVTIQGDTFFKQKPNATGRMGASELQKCTTAIRMLAYGSSYDVVDEYLKIASSIARECLLHFVEGLLLDLDLNTRGRQMQMTLSVSYMKASVVASQRSPVFDDVLQGRAPEVNFLVNGTTYNMGYYLTDGIYPRWSTFIPAIKLPQNPKQRLFTQHQEAIRKDIERAFGVLQARFAIIRKPALAWDKDILWKIIMACIIMHNMIVEDERDT
ncbi:uncharacterized protein LOC125498491 [Beta vulgaris subsp. vulgaris]|uniref:uncharacterized protein LOC125498491 n=1 Tax=Beta vulgaris subsp. vulgaris TaxID=3555 RepID=UPI002037509D|nr:uncharacterized protein LOC125498491 [Beta vulgaris subsp. vulgaris]